MAISRVVSTDFWNDSKVLDEFSAEDRYFMLYLLTNPRTTQLGIYELSLSKASNELGYSIDVIKVLLDRFETKYDLIKYNKTTGEVAIKNFLRHSIIKGGKPVMDCLLKEEKKVKDKSLLQYIFNNLSNYEDSLNITVKEFMSSIQMNNDNDNDNERIVPRIVHESSDADFSFNAEKAWNDTFAIYPKKSASATAKMVWMNKLLDVIPENQQDMAIIIYKAVKMYVADYDERNPEDVKNHQYIPKFDKWLTEDCDYWISQVEKGERE
jgi:hypothetical protein